ncbi:MAG: hypothetical protein FJ178_03580 [Gammaproteobacteria bacterium]|nr:hypothetical protein [Gammaproteobacteria bacterium]
MPHDLWQQLIVALIVVGSSFYVFWAVSGQALRLRLVTAAHRSLPPLRGPLDRIRRRLESPVGCSACRSGPK